MQSSLKSVLKIGYLSYHHTKIHILVQDLPEFPVFFLEWFLLPHLYVTNRRPCILRDLMHVPHHMQFAVFYFLCLSRYLTLLIFLESTHVFFWLLYGREYSLVNSLIEGSWEVW